MKEVTGDIWDYHKEGHPIVVTTNGIVRSDGAAVMGRGIARQAALKYPRLPYSLGDLLKDAGNQVYFWDVYNLFTFPVKYNWRDKADIELIQASASQLKLFQMGSVTEVYSVRPGCGNGQLTWEEVKPIIEPYFEKVTVVELS